jgi:dynein heavy chain
MFASSVISRRFQEAQQTDTSISAVREEYRPVAQRAAIIYFVIDDLAAVNPMYQYSLFFFKATYKHCIEASSKETKAPDHAAAQKDGDPLLDRGDPHVAPLPSQCPSTAARLVSLLTEVTEHSFRTVCRGLFEEHKSLFSILICLAIQRAAREVLEDEWNFFLRGGRTHSAHGRREPPNIQGVGPKQWAQCMALEHTHTHAFTGLSESMATDTAAWARWVKAASPHAVSPPEPFAQLKGTFHALMLLKAVRDEKVAAALSAYVAMRMGRAFAEFPAVQLKQVFPHTNSHTPIVFLLSSGSDPTAMLFKFAASMHMSESLASISLGQGQGPLAERLVDKACRKGEWVCLMNCHLCSSWMGALEAIVCGLATAPPDKLQASFRLWLTSKPAASFPVAVLQASQKITNEAPKGIRANVLGSMHQLIMEEGWESSRRPWVWKKLLSALIFFHAIVQERRKFGPLGWNVPYEFNMSDLSCAKDVLHMFVESFEDIPWQALIYVTGQINYGGRVTDELDRRCLMAIIQVENVKRKFT